MSIDVVFNCAGYAVLGKVDKIPMNEYIDISKYPFTIDDAYNQLQTCKDEIPSLFRTNALLVTSDGLLARVGSLTANSERFMAWRTVDGEHIAPKGVPESGPIPLT